MIAACNPGRWLELEGVVDVDEDGELVTVDGELLARVLLRFAEDLEPDGRGIVSLGKVRLTVEPARFAPRRLT